MNGGTPAISAVSIPTAPSPAPTTTKSAPEKWEYRWLKGIPCRAPCWEGVTPGQTTATEAEAILKVSPLTGNVQKGRDSPTPGLGYVPWDWTNGKEGGYAYYPTDSVRIIEGIYPYFGTTFWLSDVMRTYGNPSHILVRAQRAPDAPSTPSVTMPKTRQIYYDIWIVYMPLGLALRSNGGPEKPKLSENLLLNQVIFFVPTQSILTHYIWLVKEHPDWLLPWQGFQSIDYYCRDTDNGVSCHGG